MGLRNRLLPFFVLGAFVLLWRLGTWQVQRLAWKENLIAETRARAAAQPVELAELMKVWASDKDVDYRPAMLSGVFDHDREMYYYSTHKGAAGWHVFTPLQLEDGRLVLVNRGFVPDQMRNRDLRRDGLPEGPVELTGLARNPVYQKPNRFVPDNDLATRSFFWKSHAQMVAMATEGTSGEYLPFFVDAGPGPAPRTLPLGGTTRMQFPNNHLQYAITWFGLAGSLLVVYGFFWYSRRQKR